MSRAAWLLRRISGISGDLYRYGDFFGVELDPGEKACFSVVNSNESSNELYESNISIYCLLIFVSASPRFSFVFILTWR